VFTVGRSTTGVWVGRGGNVCDGYRDCDCPAWPNSIFLDLTVLFVLFVSIFGVWSLEVEIMPTLSELNNPDVHPATVINRWIAAALAAPTAARRSTQGSPGKPRE